MAQVNWRTINIDALDPETSTNFPVSSLALVVTQVSHSEAQHLSSQIKQLLRGGDSEGALRSALESAVYGGDDGAKETHLSTVVEILQSIKQADMTPMLTRIYESPGGTEALDALMKYLYKSMSHASAVSASSKSVSPQVTGFSQIQSRVGGGEGGAAAMSVLLSWHEKVVEIAGLGTIVRAMTDRRTV